MTKGGFRLADDTTTECLLFPDIFSKPVVAQFDQRQAARTVARSCSRPPTGV